MDGWVIFGSIVALGGVAWAVIQHYLSGGRPAVETIWVLTPMADGSYPGIHDRGIGVRVRNKGRAAITVTTVGLMLSYRNIEWGPPSGPPIEYELRSVRWRGPDFPARLDAGHVESWATEFFPIFRELNNGKYKWGAGDKLVRGAARLGTGRQATDQSGMIVPIDRETWDHSGR